VRRRHHGRVVQVDPIKATLKPPGIKLLDLRHDKPLSDIAFKFNLRRYTMVDLQHSTPLVQCVWQGFKP